jgi:hypothetical protein
VTKNPCRRDSIRPETVKKAFFFLCAVALFLIFSHLPALATKPRFTVSEVTIKDTKTGLVWIRDANHGKRQSWQSGHDFIRELNAQRYGGYSDWRMASREELLTLVAYARINSEKGLKSTPNVLNEAGFRNVQAGDYWSSTVNLYYDIEAWIVNMKTNQNTTRIKSLYFFVWPVRSGR